MTSNGKGTNFEVFFYQKPFFNFKVLIQYRARFATAIIHNHAL